VRNAKKKLPLASFIVAALVLVLAGSALGSRSNYPNVPVDPRTGFVTSPVPVGSPTPCPENGVVPSGSTCQLNAIGGGEYAYEVVSPAPAPAPCDRAEPPPGVDSNSCRVLQEVPSDIGSSALLSYRTASGGEVRVWVEPGGKTTELGGS
jgi:hypothetical protein